MSGDFTFLKGNIETIILCSLYNGSKYGYEIAKEIKERTSNRYEIKQPTLYSYLKRLEEDKLIRSFWGESSNGGRRRYYELTDVGKVNCQQFISEWNYQRSVLSDLVDGTADVEEISQEDATPLFGRRSSRRSKKSEYQAELDEQDEIARRLRELAGADSEEATETELHEAGQEQTVENVVYEQQTIWETPAEETATEADEDTKSRFEVNQDNPDVFIQAFDEQAREMAERQTVEHSEGENYQHVLMGVLGDQLEGVNQVEETTATTTYYEDHHAALEDVADNLAKEGIRLRIYNHATATYKSKTLIPLAKVLCQTSWLAYAFAFIYFGIFALASISIDNWQPFVITFSVLLIVPIGFTVYAILDPTRKEKPKFNFRLTIIVASALCLVVILLTISISAIGNLDFSNTVAASKQIAIPIGIAATIPLAVVIYELLYRQY
ncbi:MAG: helix-turn-helix transcriptional regulator [Clostridiales bacterium]|nr:helix-turn-helix transcriptional regulator [Clostridiales bacterium]